jgi:glutamate/tyrosine decarboxylase-like PLP-dependent enzyme
MITDPPFAPALHTALHSALAYLDGLNDRPVPETATVAELRARLQNPLNDASIDPQTVIQELVRDTENGIVGSAGGRFFAWGIGGSLPAALAADWLTSAWDQNAVLYACGPAAAVVEEVVGEWLKDLLRLPPSASFALVSGCQMAHATCLAAARNSLLTQRGWDVEQKGLFGAPEIRVLASNRHGSIERAVRLLGIGDAQVTDLPLDQHAHALPDELHHLLECDPAAPTILVLQAGDLNAGAFDDYVTLIPLAKSFGAWVHLDAAFGLWVAASPKYQHLLDGAASADSWATDGHKWLNVPYDCGYAFVAHPEAHRRAMSQRSPYMVYAEDARDQFEWTPDWSRRARGFATYAALRQLGRSGVADLIERCCAHAHALVTGIASLPGVHVVSQPQINQGLVRFLDPSPNATEEDHDAHTDEIIRRILAQGKVFFRGTTWRGRRVMRVSVLNWQTTEAHVQLAIASVAEALGVSRHANVAPDHVADEKIST